MQLQGGQVRYKGSCLTAPDGIAHCDVELLDMFGNGAEHGEQQLLVRQHDCRFYAGIGRAALQDLGQLLGLGYASGHAQQVEFRLRKALRIWCEGRWKFNRKTLQEDRRLVGRVLYFLRAPVPAELGKARVVHAAKERFLAFVQGIEADEHEAVAPWKTLFGDVCRAFLLQPLRQVSVNHALVGEALFLEGAAERVVQRQKYAPDGKELVLNRSGTIEMIYKTLYCFSLGISKIAVIVLDLPEV